MARAAALPKGGRKPSRSGRANYTRRMDKEMGQAEELKEEEEEEEETSSEEEQDDSLPESRRSGWSSRGARGARGAPRSSRRPGMC